MKGKMYYSKETEWRVKYFVLEVGECLVIAKDTRLNIDKRFPNAKVIGSCFTYSLALNLMCKSIKVK